MTAKIKKALLKVVHYLKCLNTFINLIEKCLELLNNVLF